MLLSSILGPLVLASVSLHVGATPVKLSQDVAPRLPRPEQKNTEYFPAPAALLADYETRGAHHMMSGGARDHTMRTFENFYWGPSKFYGD